MPATPLRQTGRAGHRPTLTGLTGPGVWVAARTGDTAPMVGDPLMRPGPPRTPGEQLWHEAAAGVQASVDADLRDEAYEVFVAEAARCRLVDRVGAARVTLRCGVTLEGVLAPDCDDALDGHLVLRRADAGVLHVPVSAVLQVTGSGPALRAEDGAPAALAGLVAAGVLVGRRRHPADRRLGALGRRTPGIRRGGPRRGRRRRGSSGRSGAVRRGVAGRLTASQSWSSAPKGCDFTNSRVCSY